MHTVVLNYLNPPKISIHLLWFHELLPASFQLKSSHNFSFRFTGSGTSYQKSCQIVCRHKYDTGQFHEFLDGIFGGFFDIWPNCAAQSWWAQCYIRGKQLNPVYCCYRRSSAEPSYVADYWLDYSSLSVLQLGLAAVLCTMDSKNFVFGLVQSRPSSKYQVCVFVCLIWVSGWKGHLYCCYPQM